MSTFKLLKLEHSPIDNNQILSVLDTNIIDYPNLSKYQNIDQIFKNGSCVIFYPHTMGDVGHWTCLTKRNNTIEFFDSYGHLPDVALKDGMYPYLSQLLLQSNYKLIYNEQKMQYKNTATCGRHVIVRVLLKDYPLSYYQNVMKFFGDNKDGDDRFVTWITSIIG